MTPLTVQYCVSNLWDAAKALPGKATFFGLLLYKRICDLWEEEREAGAACNDSGEPLTPLQRARRLPVPENCSWPDIRKQPLDARAKLNSAFHGLEDANPGLTGLFSCLDFSDKEAFPDANLHLAFENFDKVRLRSSEMDEATFAGMCDELMEKFASDAHASEKSSWTPRQVARLLVELLRPREGMSIYDCACGSGGILLECYQYLKRLKKNYKSLRLYGQESDPENWALCRINMVSHGIDGAMIEKGDSLRNPRHLTGDGRALMTFDRVIFHFPFNLKEWGFDEWSRGDPYGRSEYGVPPKSCGDLAFLEHAIASMNGRGMLGAVAPQGVLFRTREEAEIRRRILQDDLIEAVIGIAPDVLSSSSLPACLLILNKAKTRERRERILFVNGDWESLSGASRSSLSGESINRISLAYNAFEDQERFCRVVSLREIERNDCTLSISRYLQKPVDGPRANVAAEWQTLMKLISERNEAERKMAEYIERLEKTSDDA